MKQALIPILAMLLILGCGVSQPTEPVDEPILQPITLSEYSIDGLITETYGVAALELTREFLAGERQAQGSWCTEMTPTEIAYWLAWDIVERTGIPAGWPSPKEGVSAQCWYWKWAPVRKTINDPWEPIGLRGAIEYVKTPDELVALIDALCFMGYIIPNEYPDIPCD